MGADSATAAIMAAGLAGMAAIASPEYVSLAGMLALITGGYLILARLLKLGFIANFLSRSVLVGFLTGVGIQVAMGQVGDMFGIPKQSGGTVEKFVATLGHLGESNAATVWVSVAVIVVILGSKAISPRIPGALIAVVGSIIVSAQLDLAADGVATLGVVPGGLPNFGFPSVTWAQFVGLLGTGGAIFIVVLAQSAATSRAYAAKYEEPFDENVDLVGLGLASASAGLSGHLRGQRQPHQDPDGRRGRRQEPAREPHHGRDRAHRAALPHQAAAVHALGRARLGRLPDRYRARRHQGPARHPQGAPQRVRHRRDHRPAGHRGRCRAGDHRGDRRVGHRPPEPQLRPQRLRDRHHATEATSGRSRSPQGGQLVPGLVVYRFASGLYYANANRFNEEILALVDGADPAVPVRCIVLDSPALVDVDYSGALTLKQVVSELHDRGTRFVVAQITDDVRAELDRFGITDSIGADAYYDTVAEAVAGARGDRHGLHRPDPAGRTRSGVTR